MGPTNRPSSTPTGDTSIPDFLPRCSLCERKYLPEKKNRNHQLYCSSSCRGLAKSKRDKHHKRAYKKKEKYRLAKKEQNRRYRERKGWPEYMRHYREAHREEVRCQNRRAADKYYQKNKRKIAFRRSELRWQKKLRKEIEALKKAAP
jgi:hypothetical protein